MLEFIKRYIRQIRILLATFIGICGLFVENLNFALIACIILIVAYGFLEFYDHRNDEIALEQRIVKYILDFDNWRYSEGKYLTEIYYPNPMYTITEEEYGYGVDRSQTGYEWSRGEIGSSRKEGNYSYIRQVRFNNTVIRNIQLVSFDNGKKTIVAPDWEPIGKGRFYYYLRGSIGYSYQLLLVNKMEGKDHSTELRKRRSTGKFDIPILRDEEELKQFMQFCNMDHDIEPEMVEEKQDLLFYELLNKFAEFKNQ